MGDGFYESRSESTRSNDPPTRISDGSSANETITVCENSNRSRSPSIRNRSEISRNGETRNAGRPMASGRRTTTSDLITPSKVIYATKRIRSDGTN